MINEYPSIVTEILDNTGYISVYSAFRNAPCYYGLYVIKIKRLNLLHKDIVNYQKKIAKEKNIIYIGKADGQTILTRLICQNLSGGTSTFFRKMGSALEYKAISQSGEKYKFEHDDTYKIVVWMRQNLTVKLFKDKQIYELKLIKDFKPALNDTNNPCECEYIKTLHLSNRKIGMAS